MFVHGQLILFYNFFFWLTSLFHPSRVPKKRERKIKNKDKKISAKNKNKNKNENKP